MSFLVEDEDAHETLQVALAFIDACESAPLATTSGSRSSSSSECVRSTFPSRGKSGASDDGDAKTLMIDPVVLPNVSSGAQESSGGLQQEHVEAARTVKTSKSHLEAVKRSRAKKRAEAASLKEQVAQLEAKLRQLRLVRKVENSSLQVYLQRVRRRNDEKGDRAGSEGAKVEENEGNELLVARVPSKAPVSLWLEMAAIQARERIKSQKLNAELKEAVSKHAKLTKSLKTLLLSKSADQFGLDLLRDECKQFLYNHAVLNHETSILADLRRRVGQLYVEVDAFFNHHSWTEIAESVVLSSQLKFVPGFGPVAELRVNTPLCCSVREAGGAVWRRVMETKELIQTPHHYLKRQQLTESSYRKIYAMLFEGPDGSVMELKGTSYVQRFVRADHDAYIWASAMFSSKDEGDVFREKGWMVASHSNMSLSTASATTLSRGYCQLFCDSREGDKQDKIPSAATEERREFVLKTLSNRTRVYHQFTQFLLLHEFSGLQSSKQPLLLTGSDSC